MCKLRTLALTCFFTVCIFKGLFSQITISNTNGCLPNGITNAIFTYAGTGTPTGISWNFGDGSPTSNQNPTQHSYPNLGTFTVTFNATVNGNAVTYTATVVVNPQPTGAFTTNVPSVHCMPMTVSFQGSSPMNNVVYLWDFGDGNVAYGNPGNHTYGSPGTFNPILTIQNTLTGCFVNVTGAGINVSALPNIVVNVSPAASTCSTSLNASFNGSGSSSGSPLGGGLTYAWNFGSFGSGSGPTAGPILFQPQGTYAASLTVTDNNSCSNTTVMPISLMSPTVSASLLPTVCINSQGEPYVDITVQSNMPSISLDLDNGGGVFGFPLPIPPNPIPPVLSPNTPYTGSVVAYTTPGLKTLTFTAVSGTCITSITRTVMVEEITPTFVPVSADYTCSPSFSLAYLNQSTLNTANVLSYTWTVKHWTEPAGEYTSTAVNPTIIASQISANPYVIPGPYHPNVTLLARSAIGCSATIVQTFDTIWRPTAFFHKSVREGCAPLTVTLTDHSYFDNLINPVSGAPLNPITSYTWNAGDGVNVVVGTGSNVIAQPFTYTSTGTYTPFLVIQTAMGCPDVSFIDTVIVSNPPTISYTLPPSPVCAGQQVTVNLSSSPSSSTSIWHVESDAGYFSGCISNNAAVGAFNHVGVHGFTLSVSQRGCATTSVIPQTITVNGPVARFRFQTQCTGNKKSVDFSCYVNDATGATIDFGDQSSTTISCAAGAATSTLVAHTYSAAGDYTAIITATNTNGCPSYMYSRVIKIREIIPSFTISDTIVCKSDGTFTVDASASQGHLVTQSSGYTWIFDDDAVVTVKNPTYAVNALYDNTVGMHNVTLRIKDENGCTDLLTKTYRVSHPQPNFSFNHNPICMSDMPLQMTNLAPHSPDSIKKFWYNMGNGVFNGTGNTIINNLANPSGTYSPTYTYNMGSIQAHTFTVTQIVQNVEGCVDSVKKTLSVNNPQILFGTFNTAPATCVGKSIIFGIVAANTHSNYNIYFGDSLAFNTTAYNSNSVYYRAHTYPSPGVFTPTATLTDNAGCTVTLSIQSITVEPYPVASFTLENLLPPHPTGTDFCLPFTLSVTSTSQYNGTGNLTYYWDFGKGDITTITPNPFGSASFTNTGTFTASLTVMTPLASCPSESHLTFHVFDPHIDFTIIPDSAKRYFCLGEPITVSVTTTSGSQYFIWDFGDGVVRPKTYLPAPGPLLTSVYSNTYFPIATNGDLTIELTGYAGSNTTGTLTSPACYLPKRKTINVIKVESDFKRNDEIDLSDFRHCLGEQDVFDAQSTSNSPGTLTYTWNYGDATSGYINPCAHTYTAAGLYSIELVSMELFNSCKATTSKTIEVLPLPTSSLSVANKSCPDVPFVIAGTGTPGVSGVISGTIDPNPLNVSIVFDSLNVFTSTISTHESTTYSLVVKDNNGCISPVATASIYIPPPIKHVDWDTSVVIGQEIPLNAYLGEGYTYTWSPEVHFLNCDTCLFFNPVSSTTMNMTYTVMVEDSMKCMIEKNTYRIKIIPVTSLDVPTAFTPNGDGTNDIIYPNGWGLKKLIYFKVFNRWGQLLFESSDFKTGWNGIYQGVPQNMETYIYQVSAETFLESEPILTKTGTFKLIR